MALAHSFSTGSVQGVAQCMWRRVPRLRKSFGTRHAGSSKVPLQRGGFKWIRHLPLAPLLTGIRLFGREVKQVDPKRKQTSTAWLLFHALSYRMLQCMLGFWAYFFVFWDHVSMISGSNLDGLVPAEHLWDLSAAAGRPRCSKV